MSLNSPPSTFPNTLSVSNMAAAGAKAAVRREIPLRFSVSIGAKVSHRATVVKRSSGLTLVMKGEQTGCIKKWAGLVGDSPGVKNVGLNHLGPGEKRNVSSQLLHLPDFFFFFYGFSFTHNTDTAVPLPATSSSAFKMADTPPLSRNEPLFVRTAEEERELDAIDPFLDV